MESKKFCEYAFIYLGDIYDQLSSVIPEDEKYLINVQHKSDYGYENSYFSWLRTVNAHCGINENDVFLDLGSGLGRPVLQIAMETAVKESRGIELSKTRFQRSKRVLKLMQEKGLKTKVTFINDTFLNAEHWKSATIVYTWAECFEHLLPDIAKIIKDCETLRYVILVGCSFESRGVDLKAHRLENEKRFSIRPYTHMYFYKVVK